MIMSFPTCSNNLGISLSGVRCLVQSCPSLSPTPSKVAIEPDDGERPTYHKSVRALGAVGRPAVACGPRWGGSRHPVFWIAVQQRTKGKTLSILFDPFAILLPSRAMVDLGLSQIKGNLQNGWFHLALRLEGHHQHDKRTCLVIALTELAFFLFQIRLSTEKRPLPPNPPPPPPPQGLSPQVRLFDNISKYGNGGRSLEGREAVVLSGRLSRLPVARGKFRRRKWGGGGWTGWTQIFQAQPVTLSLCTILRLSVFRKKGWEFAVFISFVQTSSPIGGKRCHSTRDEANYMGFPSFWIPR